LAQLNAVLATWFQCSKNSLMGAKQRHWNRLPVLCVTIPSLYSAGYRIEPTVRSKIAEWFGHFAAGISRWAGSPLVFVIAALAVLAWAACGPYFDYSEGWMLIVNTGTTIVTFMMVFVIQNSQNRDGLAVQIKLDEIIRAVRPAKNTMIDLESLPQEELERLRTKFATMGDKARHPAAKRNGAKSGPRSATRA
jgi:low affinity Fe/Cu permease